MLHDYIGDDAFRKGLHNYLTEYSYKNTVTLNLWAHLAKASNKPVSEVMSSWTLQMVSRCLSVILNKIVAHRLDRLDYLRLNDVFSPHLIVALKHILRIFQTILILIL
jgi:hypothetical protein